MASEIYNVIDALSREKGIDPQIVVSAVEDAIVAATRKKEKSQENLKGEFDKESGEIRVYAVKSILPSEDDIEDPQLEISLEEAKVIDPNAEVHPARFFYASIALCHRPLDCHRALDCVHDAAELCEDPIAGGVNDTAAVLCDHGEYDGLMRLEVPNRPGFIRTHEGAVASDIGRKNRCQPAENFGLFRSFDHCRDLDLYPGNILFARKRIRHH